jgi:predicted nucleotidyltransferase
MDYHVRKLFVFGSVLTERFGPDSDIDFLVEFSALPVEDYADNYFSLKEKLEALLNRKIDLLELQALKNPYLKKSIEATQELLYAA